jgi:cupin superfamily acireductone dioxygenase involved in methionine salvage
MADPRRFELEELTNRPGTYFNPQTEVLLVVDDSPELDAEIFNLEEFEGADWVLISDDLPVDEDRRDELLQKFQTRHAGEDLEADPDEDPEDYEEEQEEVGRE